MSIFKNWAVYLLMSYFDLVSAISFSLQNLIALNKIILRIFIW